ncbi:MAG: 2-hydroxyacyl-CoA dehydratase [Candidatus Lokiarchaeota archaeon]|nr:2-hydroxyacyl-CoA dehydratase [Candidatus Lokiarchaeota archaeon]
MELLTRKNPLKCQKLALELSFKYLSDMKTAKRRNQHLSWSSVSMPVEIFNAMGITVFINEVYAYLSAASHTSTEDLQYLEELHLSRDLCTVGTCGMGARLRKGSLMPKYADSILFGTFPCPTAPQNAHYFHHLKLKKGQAPPIYIVDTPFEPMDDPDFQLNYYCEELEGAISFLEKVSGVEMDDKKFFDTVLKSYEMTENLKKVFLLRKNIPIPISAFEIFQVSVPFLVFAGTDEALNLSKILLTEVQERVKNNFSVHPLDLDVKRIGWLGTTVVNPYDLSVFKFMEERGAFIVFEEILFLLFGLTKPKNRDDAMKALAKRMLFISYNLTIEERNDIIKKWAKTYCIDGAIHHVHQGCRLEATCDRQITDALKEINIPVLSINSDCIDESTYSPSQMKTRIEAFIELLKK